MAFYTVRYSNVVAKVVPKLCVFIFGLIVDTITAAILEHVFFSYTAENKS